MSGVIDLRKKKIHPIPTKNIEQEGCVYSDSLQQHFQKEMEKWRSFSSFASK